MSAGYTSPIKEVKVGDDRILLTLASGEEIAVPRVSPKALRIEAPDSKEIDFRTPYSFGIDYRIVNGTSPTLLRVEVSRGLKVVSMGQQRDGLGGRLILTINPSDEVTGMVLIKVCDAKGNEAVKVVTLTHKPKDSTGVISDDPTPISFKDQSAKLKLLPVCDSNADGEISYAEASRVKELPKGIFKGTSIKSLEELQYFTSLGSIPYAAFKDCRKLESVVIPKGIAVIGESAFSSCESLTKVAIPEGVTIIGAFAFQSCTTLTSILIPGGVTIIGNGAFRWCKSLASLVISEGVTTIEQVAFQDTKLAKVIIPEGVTTIGWGAFDISGLKTIKLPSTLKTIELKYNFGARGSDTRMTADVIIVPRGYASIYAEKLGVSISRIVEE